MVCVVLATCVGGFDLKKMMQTNNQSGTGERVLMHVDRDGDADLETVGARWAHLINSQLTLFSAQISRLLSASMPRSPLPLEQQHCSHLLQFVKSYKQFIMIACSNFVYSGVSQSSNAPRRSINQQRCTSTSLWPHSLFFPSLRD